MIWTVCTDTSAAERMHRDARKTAAELRTHVYSTHYYSSVAANTHARTLDAARTETAQTLPACAHVGHCGRQMTCVRACVRACVRMRVHVGACGERAS